MGRPTRTPCRAASPRWTTSRSATTPSASNGPRAPGATSAGSSTACLRLKFRTRPWGSTPSAGSGRARRASPASTRRGGRCPRSPCPSCSTVPWAPGTAARRPCGATSPAACTLITSACGSAQTGATRAATRRISRPRSTSRRTRSSTGRRYTRPGTRAAPACTRPGPPRTRPLPRPRARPRAALAPAGRTRATTTGARPSTR
mmetsp:Transcript_808/g.2514  ORF Transcript_808/g.2514 Transcript_808/m.2514 type:complete len:203 (+) Transcript_808:1029-1637(+)